MSTYRHLTQEQISQIYALKKTGHSGWEIAAVIGAHKSTMSHEWERNRRVWGKEVLHIWDRGFAGNPWLTQAFLRRACFVLRWLKNYYRLDEQGQHRKPGEISKGKRSWEHRLLWDARRRCQRQTGIIDFPIADPTHRQPL